MYTSLNTALPLMRACIERVLRSLRPTFRTERRPLGRLDSLESSLIAEKNQKAARCQDSRSILAPLPCLNRKRIV